MNLEIYVELVQCACVLYKYSPLLFFGCNNFCFHGITYISSLVLPLILISANSLKFLMR